MCSANWIAASYLLAMTSALGLTRNNDEFDYNLLESFKSTEIWCMKILVGLSGGVDSAIAAYLLQQEGHEIVAGFMLNYLDEDNPNCTTKQDLESFHAVRKHLEIEAYEIFDYREEYEQRILNYIYEGYEQGITPNPDVYCNSLVKFDLFRKEAMAMGFDKIATGHYARAVSENCLKMESEDNPEDSNLDIITHDIIGICMNIHKQFSNTLTEKQYENIIYDMLLSQGYSVIKQYSIPIVMNGKTYGYRYADLLINNSIIVELKKISNFAEIKKGFIQLRDYLNQTNKPLGLFINFGFDTLKFNRFELGYSQSSGQSSAKSSAIRPIYKLLKGVDSSKDQSYFLSQLDQEQLSQALFPLGGLLKSEVRKIAHEIGLPNADRPDSQGLCFVGKVSMKDFLMEKIGPKPGLIVDLDGQELGQHSGAYLYTIGQRRNLYLPFQSYVVDVDVVNNVVTVARVGQEDALLTESIVMSHPHWISGQAPQLGQYQCKIRYRQEGQGCQLKQGEDMAYIVEFDEPIKGVANGQIVVIYDGDEVVGSGVINRL